MATKNIIKLNKIDKKLQARYNIYYQIYQRLLSSKIRLVDIHPRKFWKRRHFDYFIYNKLSTLDYNLMIEDIHRNINSLPELLTVSISQFNLYATKGYNYKRWPTRLDMFIHEINEAMKLTLVKRDAIKNMIEN